MDSIAQGRVLAWTRDMLQVESLPAFASLVAREGGDLAGATIGALVLADPGHELRALTHGLGGAPIDGPALVFVDGLVAVAPQCAALHAPWSGEYRAADHALLLPGAGLITHLLMLPLHSRGHLVGIYCLGGRDGPPALAGCDALWASHVAAAMSSTLERLFDHARLLRSGMTDPLTGWQSRRYLHARLCEEIARCQRHGTPATCVVVDVDHLRPFNERHGLPAGDRVLLDLGTRLETLVRSSDTLAHLGGDQFAILLPGTAVAQGVPLAARILAAVRAAPFEAAPGVFEPLTVSVGVAGAPPGVAGDRKAAADEWLAEAEGALYRAKRCGGNCHQVTLAGATSAPGK